MRHGYRWIMLGLVLAAAGSATPASAQYNAAVVTYNNNCLAPDGNRTLWVYHCARDNGARYEIANGQIRTNDGLCFDHGIVRGDNTGDLNRRQVKLVRCHGGQSQVWYAFSNGLVQNAANPDVCLDIAYGSGNDAPGRGMVIVWSCSANAGGNPATNQRFYLGRSGWTVTQLAMAGVSSEALGALGRGGSVTFNTSNGVRLVAAGAGNLVAAGAGNLIGQDGSTLVAAGAGNLVAAGAGNLIGNAGGTLRQAFAPVVAAGFRAQ